MAESGMRYAVVFVHGGSAPGRHCCLGWSSSEVRRNKRMGPAGLQHKKARKLLLLLHLFSCHRIFTKPVLPEEMSRFCQMHVISDFCSTPRDSRKEGRPKFKC